MAKPGKRNLITDVAGLRVGNAEDPDVLTGTTVILADEPAIAAVAVAGGGPGTRETDLLKSGTLVDQVDAIVLSGGSTFGLAAADGVAAELGTMGRGFGLIDLPGVPKAPIAPGAILYDLANGGNKDWAGDPPYQRLGREAVRTVSDTYDLGPTGAGIGARAGSHQGGLGSASIQTDDGMTVGALAAVNCFGSVYMPGTEAFWAWPFEIDREFGGVRPENNYQADAEDWGASKMNPGAGQNTTIACIATNVSLTPDQAQRVADIALTGFARAIRPVFTPFDGDAVFVLSTNKTPLSEPHPFTIMKIGEYAASTLARAIARGVYEAGKYQA